MNTFDLENFGGRLHPFFASLPLSVLILAFVLSLFAIARNSKLTAVKGLVLVAAALVGAAYLSGDLEREGASKTFTVDPEVIAVHQAWGKALLITLLAAAGVLILEANAVAGRRWLRLLGVALLFVSLVLCVVSSAKGGELVFIHGAGVTAACPSCEAN